MEKARLPSLLGEGEPGRKEHVSEDKQNWRQRQALSALEAGGLWAND